MDKIQELEERLNRLETKLKASFLEVEKRFEEMPQKINLPEDINERFNELEDLIMLLQVENTKIKERLTGGLSFGAETDVTSINERITSLEERLSEASTASEANMPKEFIEKLNKIDEYNNIMDELKDRINKLELRKTGKGAMSKVTEDVEESAILPTTNLLSDVNRLLGGG